MPKLQMKNFVKMARARPSIIFDIGVAKNRSNNLGESEAEKEPLVLGDMSEIKAAEARLKRSEPVLEVVQKPKLSMKKFIESAKKNPSLIFGSFSKITNTEGDKPRIKRSETTLGKKSNPRPKINMEQFKKSVKRNPHILFDKSVATSSEGALVKRVKKSVETPAEKDVQKSPTLNMKQFIKFAKKNPTLVFGEFGEKSVEENSARIKRSLSMTNGTEKEIEKRMEDFMEFAKKYPALVFGNLSALNGESRFKRSKSISLPERDSDWKSEPTEAKKVSIQSLLDKARAHPELVFGVVSGMSTSDGITNLRETPRTQKPVNILGKDVDRDEDNYVVLDAKAGDLNGGTEGSAGEMDGSDSGDVRVSRSTHGLEDSVDVQGNDRLGRSKVHINGTKPNRSDSVNVHESDSNKLKSDMVNVPKQDANSSLSCTANGSESMSCRWRLTEEVTFPIKTGTLKKLLTKIKNPEAPSSPHLPSWLTRIFNAAWDSVDGLFDLHMDERPIRVLNCRFSAASKRCHLGFEQNKNMRSKRSVANSRLRFQSSGRSSISVKDDTAIRDFIQQLILRGALQEGSDDDIADRLVDSMA